jgi:hypothetical protein
MGDQLTEGGMIFDPDHFACQVNEPHCRPRDGPWIGWSSSRILPHVEDIDHSQGFAFGCATLAQIDAVLRQKIDELIDDFGCTLTDRTRKTPRRNRDRLVALADGIDVSR